MALGFSTSEIEDVMDNDRNDTRYIDEIDGSLTLCVTVGVARMGRRIAVKCAFVCGNPVKVYPLSARLS